MQTRTGYSVAFLALACFALSAGAQPPQAGDTMNRGWNGQLVDREDLVPNSPALIKSLSDSAEYLLRWKLPADAEGWRNRRPEVERAFRKAIGLENLPERTPLQAHTTARHDMGDYTIENVLFESRPGFPVTGNLYRPKQNSPAKCAAIVCPIGHSLSAGKTDTDEQARCIRLAKMGFVVLVYDAIGHGERMIPGNIHHEAGYALLPQGETIAGWMVWDTMRAVDYLIALPDVDPERIGITGNSGGGLNTLFSAALDPRLRVAVVAGFTFDFNNWIKYAGAHCTCTHLPGLFRGMEWFEIAGLIAPRALMMLQGEYDGIFPIGGARRAGHNTEALFALLGLPEQVRFVELPGLPHAYSRPYRERMYGWMARFLLGQGNGEPIDEGDVHPLPERDPRLLCDPDRQILPQLPTVVELARKKAVQLVTRLPADKTGEDRKSVRRWVCELIAPPEARPHFLSPETGQTPPVRAGKSESISFLSQEGEYIPGLLWLPEQRAVPAKTVVMVDDRGKGAVAECGLVQTLLEGGFAVLSVDLRGRGETLGRYRPEWDANFRLVANQVLFGQPLAGRRAFDLRRALDYLRFRKELASNDVTVVGLGDDALPALLAAADDTRVGRVALARYFHSFVSQMKTMQSRRSSDMAETWNDAQLRGRLITGDDEVDLGSVIPSALVIADIPDILALIAPRKLLFCQARDYESSDATVLMSRFQRVLESAGTKWMKYDPSRPLDGKFLLEWLEREK